MGESESLPCNLLLFKQKMQVPPLKNWIWHKNPPRACLGLYTERLIYLTWGQQERSRYFNSFPFSHNCIECWHLFGLRRWPVRWSACSEFFNTSYWKQSAVSQNKARFSWSIIALMWNQECYCPSGICSLLIDLADCEIQDRSSQSSQVIIFNALASEMT